MADTHTKIVFCIKDEPILSMIEKEFSSFDYDVKHRTSTSRYKTVELNVNKLVPFDDDNQVTIEGYKVLFEDLRYYSKTLKN
ncbi:hypothetical protein ACFFU1_16575 [Algibacter miyuki]|uniref:Uncharacterized protein n=1 Tax=Algibacter miyuki TaxID=1306933 RepID=A0ABV5H3S3_9FLAO|nr:hypothetical protein [Algibacter miyuki]MDN3665594.1 hypothetical protein [Algibacter miyuki]